MKNFCDFIPAANYARTDKAVSAILFIAVALLAGCGGGGGGGGSSSGSTTGGGSSNTTTYSGTVVNTETGSVPSGDTIRFDSSGPSTTVSSTGTYSLTVPNADITGNDTLYIINSSTGDIITSQAIGSSTTIELVIGPPPSPPLDRKL